MSEELVEVGHRRLCCAGIDPGTANLGVAVLDKGTDKLVYSEVYSVKDYENDAFSLVYDVSNTIRDHCNYRICMERYVAYAGRQTAVTESLLMVIGALKYALEYHGETVHMYRAIDWKPALCKYLFKTKGFKNPAASFDKKYSMAAAECIIGEKLKTNHEADAVCLAYMWKLYEQANPVA
jgi:Holliday junction resolvasome RuvABC endonuclease subunit